MTPHHTFARFLAIPAIALGITLTSAAPASADDNLLPIVQEVTGTVLHAETGLTEATGNVTGTVESLVFELSSTLRQILGAAG